MGTPRLKGSGETLQARGSIVPHLQQLRRIVRPSTFITGRLRTEQIVRSIRVNPRLINRLVEHALNNPRSRKLVSNACTDAALVLPRKHARAALRAVDSLRAAEFLEVLAADA